MNTQSMRLAVALVLCFAVRSFAFLFRGPRVAPKVHVLTNRRSFPSMARRRDICFPLMAEPDVTESTEQAEVDGAEVEVPTEEETVETGEDGDGEEVNGGEDEDKESEEQEAVEGGEGEEKEVVEEKEEEVDPLAEVKGIIKGLEEELKAEERKLVAAKDEILEKGQTGFLRTAATMDNYRKSRKNDRGSIENDAKATVLKKILPVLASFDNYEESLSLETEREEKFNKNYQSIQRQLLDVFAKIGATDFVAKVGEKYDFVRHDKASEVHSEDVLKGRVLECLSGGVVVKDSVVSKAKCVVSLGPEPKPVEEKATEDPEAKEGEGDGEVEVEGGKEEEEGGGEEGAEATGKEEGTGEGGAEESGGEADEERPV